MCIFNALAPLFRGDFVTFLALIIVDVAIYMISPNVIFYWALLPLPSIVYALFWNKNYTSKLIKDGYEFAEGDDKKTHAEMLLKTTNQLGNILCTIICIFNIIFAIGFTHQIEQFAGIFSGSDKDDSSDIHENIDLEHATVSNIFPYGKLADTFNLMSEYTNLQREELMNKIKGKVVCWTLPVYEVSRDGNIYKIVILAGKNVGCDVYLENPAEHVKQTLLSIKTNDYITFVGRISGIDYSRSLTINPAIIASDAITNMKNGKFIFSQCYNQENIQCLEGKLNGENDCLVAGSNYENYCKAMKKGKQYRIYYYSSEYHPDEEWNFLGGVY